MAEVHWMMPEECDPPHGVTHWEHYQDITNDMRAHGWRVGKPALIGYPFPDSGKVQLLSGSHRWAACRALGAKIPVVLYSYEAISDLYGTDGWLQLIQQPPLVGGKLNTEIE